MSLFILKDVKYKSIIEYPDIEIPERYAIFICGESGSGKSTLLKLLNGVLSPSAGSIAIQVKKHLKQPIRMMALWSDTIIDEKRNASAVLLHFEVIRTRPDGNGGIVFYNVRVIRNGLSCAVSSY